MHDSLNIFFTFLLLSMTFSINKMDDVALVTEPMHHEDL